LEERVKKKVRNRNEVIGETETLFCPECKSILILDKDSGFRKCMRCKKKWKYVGKKNCVVAKIRIRKGERMIEDA